MGLDKKLFSNQACFRLWTSGTCERRESTEAMPGMASVVMAAESNSGGTTHALRTNTTGVLCSGDINQRVAIFDVNAKTTARNNKNARWCSLIPDLLETLPMDRLVVG